MQRYKYRSTRLGAAVHIINETTGKTHCKLENSTAGRKLDTLSDTVPDGRSVCSMCIGLTNSKKHGGPVIKKRAYEVPKGTKSKGDGFYQSWEWKQARYETIKRYGAQCMCCNSEWHVVVDHIKPRTKYPELELDLNNLQVLCNDCNQGKGRWDETDWRPKEGELSAADRAELQLVAAAKEAMH